MFGLLQLYLKLEIFEVTCTVIYMIESRCVLVFYGAEAFRQIWGNFGFVIYLPKFDHV